MRNSSKISGKLTISIFVLLAISFSALPAQAKYGGGTGEPNDPYLIFDADQMNTIGIDPNDWDKHFILMADIDLIAFTGTSFNIIGERYYDSGWIEHPFTGVFDGNGHTISNFTYDSNSETSCIGLFGYVSGENAVIKDLGLIDPNVDAGTRANVGSLVGWFYNGTITNCYVEGGSTSGGLYVGGLVGVSSGTITKCYSSGSVSGDEKVGGLVGGNERNNKITNCHSSSSVSGNSRVGGLVGNNHGTISNCYSTGNITGAKYVGGLVGWNMRFGKIISCYSKGDVSGGELVGGLVGQNGLCHLGECFPGTISNCYSTGNITGAKYVGGLVGYNERGSVTGSFWDTQTSGQTTSGGGTGLPTTEMQMQTTFTGVGWDFENIWWILEGAGYPRFWWEEKYGGGTGEPNDPYLIYTAEQMNAIGIDSNDWDKCFRLMADIDLSGFTGTTFNIIGTHWYNPFAGVFDGNGHTISNFSYTSVDKSDKGFFGCVRGEDAEIKDLGLIDPDVDAGTDWYVGSLVGFLSNGTITNCYVEGGRVSGEYTVGGLVGYNGGTVVNCYSTVSVEGEEIVGALVGRNREGIILMCYATGSVKGDIDIGGLVGENSGAVGLSYWDIETSGLMQSAGGEGKSTTEMKSIGTYQGWGYGEGWSIDDGVDYPRLVWQNAPGVLIEDEPRYYGGGSGTDSDPYLIYTGEQLNTIGRYPADYGCHFNLMADIDLNGTRFNIIGCGVPFSGVFDGNGHVVLNLYRFSNYGGYMGLFGAVDSRGEVKNLGLEYVGIYTVNSVYSGGLVGHNSGTITNCYSIVGIEGCSYLGGLVGCNHYGTITGCYSLCSIYGCEDIGGLVGSNYRGTISDCYSRAYISGIFDDYDDEWEECFRVGGLVGLNWGTISSCWAEADTEHGGELVGGLVGESTGVISKCYSTGNAGCHELAGGLVGFNNKGTISECYSTTYVRGDREYGGLVGGGLEEWVTNSFWDIETSGQATSSGGTGKTTSEMQMMSTFADAGWDFVNVWWILEGVGYPRHLWEVPVLHAEPDVTLGTSNRISWEPVVGGIEYYAECAADVNFTRIVYNSGWITETNCEFTGLELGQRYWYSVKTRNTVGIESQWSSVESSLQSTLADVIEIELTLESMKSKNLKKTLLNKIDTVLDMIDDGLYTNALSKLRNDILSKMNGCGETGEPDKNDWIITCEAQNRIYPLVIETIEYIKSLMEQSGN